MAATAGERVPSGCPLLDAAHAVLLETGGWLRSGVELRWMGEDRGCGIVATQLIPEGSELLRISCAGGAVLSSQHAGPGEDARFQAFLAQSVSQEPDSGCEGSAQLVLRLTYLLLRLGRSLGTGTALERYIEAVPSLEDSPDFWPEEAVQALRGSAIFPKVTAFAKGMADEAASLVDLWPADTLDPAPGREEMLSAYRRAKAFVGSRALNAEGGVVLCPVLDLVNHAGPDHAVCRYSFDDGAMRLRARRDIAPGSEVCMCYDRDADYLDMFERYGFFDATAWIHTAEILVQDGTSGVEAGAYWIPEDSVPLDCPLLALLRAEHKAAGGSSDEEAEMTSLRSFVGLIRSHLAAYPDAPGAETAANACDNTVEGQRLRAARSVIAYEKRLLSATAAKIEGILSSSEWARRLGDEGGSP